jgi:hypothetical protein
LAPVLSLSCRAERGFSDHCGARQLGAILLACSAAGAASSKFTDTATILLGVPTFNPPN